MQILTADPPYAIAPPRTHISWQWPDGVAYYGPLPPCQITYDPIKGVQAAFLDLLLRQDAMMLARRACAGSC